MKPLSLSDWLAIFVGFVFSLLGIFWFTQRLSEVVPFFE